LGCVRAGEEAEVFFQVIGYRYGLSSSGLGILSAGDTVVKDGDFQPGIAKLTWAVIGFCICRLALSNA